MPLRINIPPITRGLLIGLFTLSLLSAVVRYRQWSSSQSKIVVPYLNLIPQLSIIYPWTFLLTTFVENNVFTLAISSIAIYYGGRYLERAWGTKEFIKFIVICALIPNTLSCGTLIFLYAMTGDITWTLTRIAGCVPLEISFLVAFSQLVPAHTVALFKGIISMRVPRFPGLYVLTVIVLAFTPVLTSAAVFLALYGFMVSWVYLRFYKTAFPDLDTSQSTLRGDASESFALAEFFPEPLRPAVSHISESVFALLVSIRLCSPFSAADSVAHHNRGDFSSSRSTPGSSRAETERRRALALKALDQRLNASMTSKVSQPTNTLGGDVVQQPGSVVQAPMIDSKNNGILGETSCSPEGEDSNH